MKDIVNRIKRCMFCLGLAGALIVGGQQAHAFFFPCCGDGDCYLDLDFLIWKPMHCPIFVARRFNGGQSDFPRAREEFYLDGDYNPGVRVRLGFQECDWFADLSYLYFCSKDDLEKDRDGFTDMVIAGARGFAQARVLAADAHSKFRYQNVDGRAGPRFCLRDCFDLYLYGNARWVKIDFEDEIRGPSEFVPAFTDFLEQEAYFNGGGFGLGVGGNYYLCGGFSLHANTGVMAIIGETKLKKYESGSIESVEEIFLNSLNKDQSWVHILPAFDFKIGINTELCWHCLSVLAEFGYELNYYTNALRYTSDNITPSQGSAEIPLFTCQDIGFAGPYINVLFRF